MSCRKRIHRQRQLGRERVEEALARRRLVRNLALGAAGMAGLVAVVASGFIFLTGGSAEEPAASMVVSIGDNFFEPTTLNIKAGEKTKITLFNSGQARHNLWTSGPDAEAGTGDDIRSKDLDASEISPEPSGGCEQVCLVL
jgi:plastocyanin